MSDPEFDSFAGNYDEALQQGLAVTGENKDYFAHGRLKFLADLLKKLKIDPPRSVLDFGCGTGSATPFLIECLGAKKILGVDVSDKSLDVARKTYGSNIASFQTIDSFQPDGSFDLAFVNGVFHHIPLDQRESSVAFVRKCLKPGAVFAFWENNPWNPGTQWVMARCPFDGDAIKISPPGAKKLLRGGGFTILRTDFLFIFPKMLSILRGLEPMISRAPLGGQYEVLCRAPM